MKGQYGGRCPICKFIADAVSPDGKNKPCTNCSNVYGKTNRLSWGIWPNQNISRLLEELDEMSSLERRFASAELVLYCSAVEGLLVDFLRETAELYSDDVVSAYNAINKAFGLGGLLKLYYTRTDNDIGSTLRDIGFGDWYSEFYDVGGPNSDMTHMRGLYQKRNACIHGPTTLKFDSSLLARVDESRLDCLKVFRALNNWTTSKSSSHA